MKNTTKYLFGAGVIIIILMLVIIIPVQAFGVNHLDYSISDKGDALVTANYNLSFVESLALPLVKGELTNAIKSEYGQDSEVLFMTDTTSQFTIPKFADSYPTYVQTPQLNFEHIKSRVDSYWFLQSLDIDYSPEITTIDSFNGSVFTYYNQTIIPAMTLER
jgi:hypothetical protein